MKMLRWLPIALAFDGGCAAADQGLAEEAGDSMDSVTVEAALVVASLDGMTATTTPEDAANNSAANAAEFWAEGCFNFTVDGASITYDLTACSGPFGLVDVNGSVTITYRMTRSSIGFDITTTNLTVGEAIVDFTVNADVATDGRNVSVMSMGTTTGRRGNAISYSGTYDVRWNGSSDCGGLDGSWTSTVAARSVTLSVANWQRCDNDCPQSGTLTYSGPASTVTVNFDGSNQASWTSENGSGSFDLFCGG